MFLKSTTIGVVVCGVLSANALAAEAAIPDQSTKNASLEVTQWQEYSVSESLYQGDFQQLWKPLRLSAESEKLYTGENSVAVTSGILQFL